MILQYIKDLSENLNNAFNAQGIIRVLEEFFSPCEVESIDIYVFDETTNTLRDFARSWMGIDECLEKDKSKEIYVASPAEFNQLPPVLINALNTSKYLSIQNYRYLIPQGKENLWHKIEDLLKFYLGFRLLV